jgi:hypothetical protein
MITKLIDAETAAVDLATATAFEVTFATSLTADYMSVGEIALVYRLGGSGDYLPATNKDGSIYLSAFPNMVLLDIPGQYKVTKGVTQEEVTIGYEG